MQETGGHITQWAEYIQGMPMTQALCSDDVLVSLLLVCFFVLAAVLADKENFLGNLLKEFFLPHTSSDDGVKINNKYYVRVGLYGVSFISMALFSTAYLASMGVAYTYRGLLLAFVVVWAAYIVKQELYRAVNWVFYERSHTMNWRYYYSNWTILSGVCMYVVTVCSIFFDLCSEAMSIVMVVFVVLAEICLFYKAFHIFSQKKYGSLQLFVYLCTLEIIPLLLIGKVLANILDN